MRYAGLVSIVFLALLTVRAEVARAEPVPRLYESVVIVTGTDMRSRPSGFAHCLTDVLVKVSGNPALASDPRVAALGAHADTMVVDFDYWDRMSGIRHHDSQGADDRPYNLTVRFDPAKVDAALAELGEKPWGADRPPLYAFVDVQARSGSHTLTSDGEASYGQNDAMSAAGTRYGLPVRLPAQADVRLRGEEDPPRTAAMVSLPQDAPLLIGTLAWSDSALGWVGSWHMVWRGQAHAWSIRGVNFDEAFRDAVRGAMGVLSGHEAGE
jgi:hypothetical protein